jgi:hypothetical protein
MARFVKNAHGEQACLVRSDKYSKSTGRHKYYVRCALGAANVLVFHVNCESAHDHGAHVREYQQRIHEHFDKAVAAREQAIHHLVYAQTDAEEMQAYCEFFDYTPPAWANPLEQDDAKREALETKLTKLSIKTGVPIHAFWRHI